MSKYVYLLAKTMAVAFIVSLIYFSFFANTGFYRNPVRINRDIYHVFQQIYHGCRAIDFASRSRDCRVVVDVFNRCARGEWRCSVSEYYRFLDDLGFKLPPYYVDD